MIKKYKQYIKEKIDYSEVDPWGEEDWGVDHIFISLTIKNKMMRAITGSQASVNILDI